MKRFFKIFLAVINLSWTIGFTLPSSEKTDVEYFPQDNSLYVERKSDKIWMAGKNKALTLVELNADPEEREEPLDIEFLLYTRKNPTKAYTLQPYKENEILESPYMKDSNTYLLFHDWSQNRDAESNVMIRDALLKQDRGNNVIVVDWSDEVFEKSYVTAAGAVTNVAKLVFQFLKRLRKLKGGNTDQLHFIGHGIGAHIAGNTGRMFDSPIGRITGLDPVGPLFYDSEEAINKKDARYVEIIHTDIMKLGLFRDGLGHAQFLPNGGRGQQPGCSKTTCSHNMAYRYFVATLEPEPEHKMIAKHCKDIWEAMVMRCKGAQLEMGGAEPIKNIPKDGYYSMNTLSMYHVTKWNSEK